MLQFIFGKRSSMRESSNVSAHHRLKTMMMFPKRSRHLVIAPTTLPAHEAVFTHDTASTITAAATTAAAARTTAETATSATAIVIKAKAYPTPTTLSQRLQHSLQARGPHLVRHPQLALALMCSLHHTYPMTICSHCLQLLQQQQQHRQQQHRQVHI